MLASPVRFCLLLALVSAGTVSAQTPEGRLGRSEMVRSTAPGYYVYHQPGEATIQVSVQGAVRSPGLYEVAVGTDLGRLLALAGGAALDAREANERQRAEVRLFRPSQGVIYATLLQDVVSAPENYPALNENDALIVEVIRRRTFGWQEAAALLGALGTFGFLIQAIR